MSALLFEKINHLVTLTINRPESRNPLGEDGDGDLYADAVARINADRDVRCVILTGAGKAFSAGGNLKAMKERSGTFAGPGVLIRERYRHGIHRMVRALWGVEVPMIAAVNGPAIGLGNDVACLADMRIAADTAIFGATFLKVGLVPGDGGAWILPRTIGMARAAELFFTGDTIDAATALSWARLQGRPGGDAARRGPRAGRARLPPAARCPQDDQASHAGRPVGQLRRRHGDVGGDAGAGPSDARPRGSRGRLLRQARAALHRRIARRRVAAALGAV